MNEYHIEEIPVGKLVECAERALVDKKTFPFLPISLDRAIAQANNPAASEDDIGLILAFYNEICIGYRGLLPCLVNVGRDTDIVNAPSTFYIAPEYRGKKLIDNITIAEKINTVAIEQKHDFLGTGFSQQAIRYYQSDKRFQSLSPLPYLRINIGWLSPFSSIFKKLSRINKISQLRGFFNFCTHIVSITLDRLINIALKSWINPVGSGTSAHFNAVKVNTISALTNDSTDGESSQQIKIHRDVDVINWMLNYPWIKNDQSIQSRYHFATPRTRFEFLPYHLIDRAKNKRVGYAVYSISVQDEFTTLKILDYKTLNDKIELFVLANALDIARREDVNTIECSMDFWKYIEGKGLLRKVTRSSNRVYAVYGKKGGLFEQQSFNIELNYTDCDKPYT